VATTKKADHRPLLPVNRPPAETGGYQPPGLAELALATIGKVTAYGVIT
jgi:hypothetical protein